MEDSQVQEICDLVIDTDDLKMAGLKIPEDRLSDFGDFLQDFVWTKVDLLALLREAADYFE